MIPSSVSAVFSKAKRAFHLCAGEKSIRQNREKSVVPSHLKGDGGAPPSHSGWRYLLRSKISRSKTESDVDIRRSLHRLNFDCVEEEKQTLIGCGCGGTGRSPFPNKGSGGNEFRSPMFVADDSFIAKFRFALHFLVNSRLQSGNGLFHFIAHYSILPEELKIVPCRELLSVVQTAFQIWKRSDRRCCRGTAYGRRFRHSQKGFGRFADTVGQYRPVVYRVLPAKPVAEPSWRKIRRSGYTGRTR